MPHVLQYEIIFVYLFIYCLFNDADGSLDYTVLNDAMTWKGFVRKRCDVI